MNESRVTDVVDLSSSSNELSGQGRALIAQRIVFRRCYDSCWQAAEPDVQGAPRLELFSAHVRYPLLQRPRQGRCVQSPSRPFLLNAWLRQRQIGVGTNQQESPEAATLYNQPLGRQEGDQAPALSPARNGEPLIDPRIAGVLMAHFSVARTSSIAAGAGCSGARR